MSLRRAVARPAGVDDLNGAVAAYERSALSACQKVALRLADRFLANPSGLGPEHRAEALECFTPAQIVELVLKLVSFSSDKTAVALGLDGPADEHRLSAVQYDDGVPVVFLAGAADLEAP